MGKKLRRVRTTTEEHLLTLASDTASTQTLTGTSSNAYRAMTAKNTWTLSEFTAGEGPIQVGYAHSDYTVAEIKECIESQGSVEQNDKVAQERANRLVRTVGTFGSEANSQLNDGKPIKTRLNWLIGIGESVVMFAWNEGTAALTTGSHVNLGGDLWIKDL